MTDLWTRLSAWMPGSERIERKLDAVGVEVWRKHAHWSAASTVDIRNAAEQVHKVPTAENRIAHGLALFAVAAQRELGWTPFDVQIRAASGMALGYAVEMQTGEGKTLAVAAAATVLALQHRQVHVATVNQYLAERDGRLFSPVIRALGLEVGILNDRADWPQKRDTYRRPVVYGTGYAFGFDYLREQLRLLRMRSTKSGELIRRRLQGESQQSPYQPVLDCTIVDELDAVLLDEAGVPLILNELRSTATDDLRPLQQAANAAAHLILGTHFVPDAQRHQVVLTEAGIRAAACPLAISRELCRPWRQYLEDALKAAHALRRDVDYVVADDKIWIVDGSTGRIFADRRWPEGLQHAVELREGLPLSASTIGAARITRQRFFKLYKTLTGTSGTLREANQELASTYGLRICAIAPRLPSQLVQLPVRSFRDASSRNEAIVAAAAAQRNAGRPVLIGCRTISASEQLSGLFHERGLAHQILNGTQTAEEAAIVAQAGRSGNVLIATNLAGRGTDIRLDDAAVRAGGLSVLGVEYHESPRIDRQLIGRAGRQGDPGSGQFFLSAEDSLFRNVPDVSSRLIATADGRGESRTDISAAILRVRSRAEASAREQRRTVTAADAWMDEVLSTLARAE